jgi:hypothetical protein
MRHTFERSIGANSSISLGDMVLDVFLATEEGIAGDERLIKARLQVLFS